MSQLQRTPLFPFYQKEGGPAARCIDFGGWELPVQFYGIGREHDAVRMKAGLFDVSHMGEFEVSGPQAESFVQQMTTNDVSRLAAGQAQYTLMCYPDGGVVDDLLVYKRSAEHFMLVVNASNIAKDFAWLNVRLPKGAELRDRSETTALLALQGPLSESILSRLADADLAALLPFHFLDGVEVCGKKALVSRTGYTGEDGFEIYCGAADAPHLWEQLLTAGEPDGLIPAGLGARDTLRFEARLPLYGQELSDTISPLEAGLGMFVKLDKGDFIGRDALAEQKTKGLKRKLVGIEMIDRGIPRAHYTVHANDRQIGEVTTGTQSPTLKRNLGLALLDIAHTGLHSEVWVDVRGKMLRAEVVSTPFYKRSKPADKGEKPG
ncbi:glycine cleavage system protein T [Cohnella kolymensis]|uniref:Aminomethyltransferase n=1 Tax=Cohnella kolymensis TaxID=1590652 RepID=A0ABR5A9B9_9BACL|nr:glycine cleavage system aminomethyltransferase GcvT [Cohnella kolymensis]KIL37651.1 glycine cleavage system protein T [Cohnella kolymensis]